VPGLHRASAIVRVEKKDFIYIEVVHARLMPVTSIDRVDRPDFMKMDLVDGNAVDLGLSLGYASKDFFAGSKNLFVIPGFFDDRQDLPGVSIRHWLVSFIVRMFIFMGMVVFVLIDDYAHGVHGQDRANVRDHDHYFRAHECARHGRPTTRSNGNIRCRFVFVFLWTWRNQG